MINNLFSVINCLPIYTSHRPSWSKPFLQLLCFQNKLWSWLFGIRKGWRRVLRLPTPLSTQTIGYDAANDIPWLQLFPIRQTLFPSPRPETGHVVIMREQRQFVRIGMWHPQDVFQRRTHVRDGDLRVHKRRRSHQQYMKWFIHFSWCRWVNVIFQIVVVIRAVIVLVLLLGIPFSSITSRGTIRIGTSGCFHRRGTVDACSSSFPYGWCAERMLLRQELGGCRERRHDCDRMGECDEQCHR